MDRLLIVSNRLPVKLEKTENGLKSTVSAGGLATGLKSYHRENNSVWIGWSGVDADSDAEKKEITQILYKEQCSPVFLEKSLVEGFYDGFSNSTLWPLFHYFTEYTEFNETYWELYKKANQLFANEVIAKAKKNDTVWVHDYQLLLVPEMIKNVRPDLTIGFFLHIPFPSYEVFRILPWREELLNGILGSDLVGFHTYDYARHFISSAKRLLGCDINFNTLQYHDRQIFIDVFPMGIDYDKFTNKANEIVSKPIQDRSKLHRDIDRFLMDDPDRKIILSIDRLDYTKGIPERIKAFRRFLVDHPEFKEKVSLVMLTVPSRVDVEQYQSLKSEIEEMVGGINGEFGSLNWNPIIYFYRSLPFDNLLELYSSAEIALLTPLRDGMNLVAKEFIASKINHKGVLILSEMAGATKELGEALLVNPNNIKGVASAIYKALTMSEKEQYHAMQTMQERIGRYNVYKWASDFMDSLKKTNEKLAINMARKVSDNTFKKIISQFKGAGKKLLFLDYDGTLQRFYDNPLDASPDEELYKLLDSLFKAENTELVIISGRDKNTLNEWFGHKGYSLIAEHGVWKKVKGGSWEERKQSHSNWKASIRPVLESYVDRTPGSLIEEKSHSLVFHYRKSDIELGALRALELTTDLSNLLLNQDLEIFEGSKVIEVKIAGINKGGAAIDYIGSNHYDFILALGDDWTDEYLFKELPKEAITIKVGTDRSEAKYFVNNPSEVRNLLTSLLN